MAAKDARRRYNPEARREAILQAAMRLFAQQGFVRTTTKAIAREAGVAEGTIYTFFASKHDLLFAILAPEIVEPLQEIISLHEGNEDEQTLYALLANRYAIFERYHPLIKVIIGEAIFNPEVAEKFHRMVAQALTTLEGYLAQRVADGAFRPMNVPVVARTLVGNVLIFFIMRFIFGQPNNMGIENDTLFREIATQFLDGARSRPATCGELESRR